MSTSFQYEDPMNRANVHVSTMAQTKIAMKDMGSKMLASGKGFAKVGAVYSGVECCVEGVRPNPTPSVELNIRTFPVSSSSGARVRALRPFADLYLSFNFP